MGFEDENETRLEKLSLAGVAGLEGGFDPAGGNGDARPEAGGVGRKFAKAEYFRSVEADEVEGFDDQSKPSRSFILRTKHPRISC